MRLPLVMLGLLLLVCSAHGTTEIHLSSRKGTTMVPLRLIAEWLGAKVGFDSFRDEVTVVQGVHTWRFTIGSTQAFCDGTPITLSVAPTEDGGGATCVPVRLICEGLGAAVMWDDDLHEVKITHPNTGEHLLLPFCVSQVIAPGIGSGDAGQSWRVSPLHVAAYSGCTTLAEKYLAAGEDLNARDPLGLTPLSYAVLRGQTALVTWLVKQKADVNTSGLPPLMIAASGGWYAQSGGTRLFSVPGSAEVCDRIVEVLLTGKPCFTARIGEEDLTLLQVALDAHIAEMLIDAGAPLDVTAANDEPLLVWMVRTKHTDIARVMVEHGVALNEADLLGFTALMHAAAAGMEDVVVLLLDHGADPNTVNRTMGGGTALHAAAVSDSLRRWAIAKALLDHGADLSIRGKGGQTALSLAIERGDEDMVKLLRKPAKAE